MTERAALDSARIEQCDHRVRPFRDTRNANVNTWNIRIDKEFSERIIRGCNDEALCAEMNAQSTIFVLTVRHLNQRVILTRLTRGMHRQHISYSESRSPSGIIDYPSELGLQLFATGGSCAL